jgi:hypothetical protein
MLTWLDLLFPPRAWQDLRHSVLPSLLYANPCLASRYHCHFPCCRHWNFHRLIRMRISLLPPCPGTYVVLQSGAGLPGARLLLASAVKLAPASDCLPFPPVNTDRPTFMKKLLAGLSARPPIGVAVVVLFASLSREKKLMGIPNGVLPSNACFYMKEQNNRRDYSMSKRSASRVLFV